MTSTALISTSSLFRVLAYRGTWNLGDAVQTVSLCRLLGQPCHAVYRDEPHPASEASARLVVNGWLGYHVPKDAPRAVFAGIHLGGLEAQHRDWLRRNGEVVGARDPFTHDLLRGCRLDAELIGCATLTWPRYRGLRRGRYSVDVDPRPGTVPLTNRIGATSWSDQWTLALQRLEQLRTAEIVYTNRLHVVLPCLAFGTPVVYPLSELGRVKDKHRLTLLGALGFGYDEEVVLDVEPWARRYVAFLERALGTTLAAASNPPCPPVIAPHALDRDAARSSDAAPRRPPGSGTGGRTGGRTSRTAPRIFFLSSHAPSYTAREQEAYRHVDILNAHGYEAFILKVSGHGEESPAMPMAMAMGREGRDPDSRDIGESAPHAPPDVPVVTLATVGPYYDSGRDIIVCSERTARYLTEAAGRKVLSLRRASFLLGALDAGVRLPQMGVVGTVVNSQALARCVQLATPDLPASLVHDAPDPGAFRFRSWEEKQPLIVAGAADAPIASILRSRARLGCNRFDRFRYVRIETASSTDVARLFEDAVLVFATDAGPAIQAEARAAGCIVLTRHATPTDAPAPTRPTWTHDLPATIALAERVMDDFLERRPSRAAQDELALAASAETLRSLAANAARQQEHEVVTAWQALLAESVAR